MMAQNQGPYSRKSLFRNHFRENEIDQFALEVMPLRWQHPKRLRYLGLANKEGSGFLTIRASSKSDFLTKSRQNRCVAPTVVPTAVTLPLRSIQFGALYCTR